jgi:Domain of unknown function (DUF4384)
MKPMWIIALAVCGAAAQTATRGIVPEEVLRARQKAADPASKPSASQPKYQPAGAPGHMPRPAGGKQVGVTFWRLRPATAVDRGARLLVQQEANTAAWIPERISSTTSLRAGDRVRLTLESPEAGYLYVIDRERYANGERGAPYLIFPTARTRNGDNRVAAGKLIDIPAQEDQPNFFTMTRSRADQVEEEVTVLLTSSPLDGITIGPKALALPGDQVANWEKQWGRKAEVFELAGGAGKAWTAAEQEAAAGATRLLTQQDPPPQTVYRVESRPSEPLLVKLRLRYEAKGQE